MMLLILSGLASFVGALALVLRGRGPFVGAALLLVINLPLLCGLYGAINGIVDFHPLSIVSKSSSEPKAAEVLDIIASSLGWLLFGLIVMVPGYIVAMVGAIVRSLSAAERTTV